MANELRQLIDTANAPIFGIDVRGTVNEWNNKTGQITGYSREEAIGKPLVNTFIVKELRESVQRVMDLALRGQETSNYELEFRTKVRRIKNLVLVGSFFLLMLIFFQSISKVQRNSTFVGECYNPS